MSAATLEKPEIQRTVARNPETTPPRPWGDRLESAGGHTIRYGLVLVLAWIGAMKFTAYEANGISGLVANSPLLGWAYEVFSVGQFSAILGVTELLIAGMIALRPLTPRLSAVGSLLAAGMFLTTINFLVTTPGVNEPTAGALGLSVVPGQFLIKDFVLLGAALWTAGEALGAARRRSILWGAALHGYDPVAYFTLRRPVEGNVEIASTFEQKRYHFSSLEHKELFDREPQRYQPQYGGYCAFGVAIGKLFAVDPRTGQVIDGKLYVNLNRKILADFNKDPRGYIDKAGSNWPGLGGNGAA